LVGPESTHQVDHCVGAEHRRFHTAAVGNIAAHELDLPEIGGRAQVVCLLRMATDHADAGVAAPQFLGQMRADEAAAADEHDELLFERCEISQLTFESSGRHTGSGPRPDGPAHAACGETPQAAMPATATAGISRMPYQGGRCLPLRALTIALPRRICSSAALGS